MTWTQKVSFDEDTVRLLEIAQHFLGRYFGHEADDAERLISRFIESAIWDEDTLHHESAYRVAAATHYLFALDGDRSSLGTWLLEEGHNHPPPAAAEYFWKHYLRER